MIRARCATDGHDGPEQAEPHDGDDTEGPDGEDDASDQCEGGPEPTLEAPALHRFAGFFPELVGELLRVLIQVLLLLGGRDESRDGDRRARLEAAERGGQVAFRSNLICGGRERDGGDRSDREPDAIGLPCERADDDCADAGGDRRRPAERLGNAMAGGRADRKSDQADEAAGELSAAECDEEANGDRAEAARDGRDRGLEVGA